MVSGHLKYAQGAISSTLGYETGEQTKQAGLQEMRDAKAAQPDTSSDHSSGGVLGSVENMAGKMVGCEGMEKEGEERKAASGTTDRGAGLEEQNGTG